MRWIIGDVHGMLKSLEALLRYVDSADPQPRFIFAGDYINRGPDSRGVVELLLTLRSGRFLRGNHDDVFDQILSGNSYLLPEQSIDALGMYRAFCEHGLVQTLESYGLEASEIRRPFGMGGLQRLREVAERIPASHRVFFRSLNGFIEDGDFFVVHGKWPTRASRTPATTDGALAPYVRRDMLWGRFGDRHELLESAGWSKPGFFGHTPVQTYPGHENHPVPIHVGKATLLDTGVAVDPHGRLSAISVESGQLLQVDREGRRVG